MERIHENCSHAEEGRLPKKGLRLVQFRSPATDPWSPGDTCCAWFVIDEPTTPPARRWKHLEIESCNSERIGEANIGPMLFDMYALATIYCASVKVLVMLARCCPS